MLRLMLNLYVGIRTKNNTILKTKWWSVNVTKATANLANYVTEYANVMEAMHILAC